MTAGLHRLDSHDFWHRLECNNILSTLGNPETARPSWGPARLFECSCSVCYCRCAGKNCLIGFVQNAGTIYAA